MPGNGNLVNVEGIMKEEGYMKILKENLKQSAEKRSLGHRLVFQHINVAHGEELPPED